MTLTDGLIYDPSLKPYEVKDGRSGTPDDRYVFTSRFSPAGTMGTIVSLASSYKALKPYYPEEAERSLKNAIMLWDKNFEAAAPAPALANAPANRRGGGDQRISAAIELYYATDDVKYKDFFLPILTEQINPKTKGKKNAAPADFSFNIPTILRIYDLLDTKTQAKVDAAIPAYVENLMKSGSDNPYGVPITGAGWAGNGTVINNSYNLYVVWQKYPDLVDPEAILKGLNYLFGCHPYNNLSFVTSVGVNTKKVAYGNNRADYTVIPGGIVPGLIVKAPDFLENKDDYPFHWGENECCINTAPQFVRYVMGCMEVADAMNK